MEKHCSYSVVIRTLGNTGEKYQRLLSSITKQTIPPKEIIVAIPEGYELDYRIGTERIVRAQKGMVSQRAEGIKAATGDYLLVCDDDVEFDEKFVEDLYYWQSLHHLDCTLPMEGEADPTNDETILLQLPVKTRLRGALTGQVFISQRPSPFLDVITTTAGHKIFVNSNRLDECYLCQCGNFQCFFISREAAREVHLEDELWLQEGTLTKYSSYDDPTFYYKLFLQGGRIGYALRTRYTHLDAAAGRPAKKKLDEKIIRYYSVARNRTVFWHRFLWRPAATLPRKVAVLAGGMYGTIMYTIWSVAVSLHPKYWRSIAALFRGYYDGLKTIRALERK